MFIGITESQLAALHSLRLAGTSDAGGDRAMPLPPMSPASRGLVTAGGPHVLPAGVVPVHLPGHLVHGKRHVHGVTVGKRIRKAEIADSDLHGHGRRQLQADAADCAESACIAGNRAVPYDSGQDRPPA